VVRDALTTPEDIDRCIDFAFQARFHILFVQVRGRADAYYRSSLEPPAIDLKYPVEDFDPLTYLLARARATGISVHAWINVFFVWSNGGAVPPEGHVVHTHPEWLATNAEGMRMDERTADDWKASGFEGYYVSPFPAHAREHVAAVVRELVDSYPVDGIHLDYVRYPGPEFGFGRDVRTRFALEWGIDPVALRSDPAALSAILGADAAATLDSVWTDWRAQQVDSTVMAIRDAVGDLPVSAAVIPELVRARIDKGQDWPGWLRRRWVDFVVPMAYNYRPEELLDWVRIVHNTVGRERMLVGLAVYGGRDQYIDRAVNILRVDRVAGFSVFSYNVLVERRFAANFVEQIFLTAEQIDQTGQEEQEEQIGQDEE
jgi:uncharacterized lipoprotein YddW (UPF0748 family)